MSDQDPRSPITGIHILVNALNQDVDRPLLHVLDGPTLTVREVRDTVSRYVQAFASLGVTRGAKVGVLSANRPEVLFATQAIQLLAAITTALHPLGGVADHAYVAQDSGLEILVFDTDRYAERAVELAQRTPGLRLIGLGPSAVAADLCELAASFPAQPLVAPNVDLSDIIRLGYSGGTTGKPKAIASTYRESLASLQIMMAEWEWPTPARVMICAPLSHAGTAMIMPALLKGGSLLITPGFEPVTVMKAIEDYRINCTMLVPTMIYALLDHPRFGEFDLSSLETIFYGASAMSPVRLREAIERIGPVFFQFYGQAEAPMTITVMKKAEHDPNDLRRLASCGRPVPWVNVALLDSENRPVPDGEPGEICVQGSLVFSGYRDNPELTAQTFAGGWHHTGDVAVKDPDGFLRIVDRTKDMIVSGGFNIYPRELEDIIAEHPGVAQVAVVGAPHPKWGEAVTAFVVLRPGKTAAADELAGMVAQRKGAFQAPKRVEFIDAIPQTPVGKPDKKALRARLAEEPV
jgi:fatty-acyl-CoA synthase